MPLHSAGAAPELAYKLMLESLAARNVVVRFAVPLRLHQTQHDAANF